MAPTTHTIDPTRPAEAEAAELCSFRLSDAEADRYARDIVNAHLGGSWEETEVRKALLALVFNQGIVTSAVDAYGVPASMRSEIIAEVDMDIVEVVLGDTFDLSVAATHSICGFVRKRAHFTAMSKTRDARRAQTRNGAPSDPTTMAATVGMTGAMTIDDLLNMTTEVIDEAHQALESWNEEAQNLRGTARVRFCAQRAYTNFGVPRAVRPALAADREALHRALSADRSLAHRSLVAFARAVHGGDTRAAATYDATLLGLWDNYRPEHIEALFEENHAYAHAVAIDAVAPWARPAQKDIQRYRAQVAALRPGDLQWRSLANALVAAFIDHEFQAISDFVAVEESKAEAMRQGQVIRRSQLADLVGRASRYDGYPLGASPAQVKASLVKLAVAHLKSKDLNAVVEAFQDAIT